MTRTQPFTITSIVSLRRFLTHDPTGFTTGLNLYAYLKNNPLKYCDPTGEFFFLIPLLVFGSEGVAFLGMSTMTAALLDAACCAVISYSCLKLNESIDHFQEMNLATLFRIVMPHIPDWIQRKEGMGNIIRLESLMNMEIRFET